MAGRETRRPITRSHDHTITRSHDHTITRSHDHTITLRWNEISDNKLNAITFPNKYCADITRAVLRLECSLDCISGSVGHQQNIFIFSLSALLLKLKKCNYKKCNWVSGSPSILYKLVLSPVPIVHTNFQENLLMSYS